METQTIPKRSEVPAGHRWNLASLFVDEAAWEEGFSRFKQMLPAIAGFRGGLASSAEALRACLDFMMELGRLVERLGYYAQLRSAEDGADSAGQDRLGRFMQAATEAEALASWQTPEIQAIPDQKMNAFLSKLGDYRIHLEKLLRFKPHVLSDKEERLLAMQEEANQTAHKAFSALCDVDLDFGTVKTPQGERPLSQSSFQSFMLHPDRSVREEAMRRFMAGFEAHKNSLAALYAGSLNLDIYRARVRNFASSREASLFPDKVPEAVYENLVAAVNRNLGLLHQYYELRRRLLGLDKLKLYDVRVPLLADVQAHHDYDQAVERVLAALEPLGPDYVRTLAAGLKGGWVDRFENRGKRSGAFSAGSYQGDPYILLNHKDDVLSDVFTLAHEAGHSMHSWYSVRANPFQHYNYSIFEAEVASTFNEQLLMKHFLDGSDSPDFSAYLVNRELDGIIGTFFRQTMFAEFENLVHAAVEAGRPATLEALRSLYRGLQAKYFGPAVELEEQDDLECLRIPHFYHSFYVYKYATGIAAAVYLSRRVLHEGAPARADYFRFLSSGGSRYPLESLRLAGVDMESAGPVEAVIRHFAGLLERLRAHFEAKGLMLR